VEKYMSSKTTKRAKIQSPNENGSGFIWAIIAVVLVAVAVIAYVIISGNKSQEEKFAETYNETTAFNNKVDGSAVQLVSDKADKAKTVDIYEDFSCHYCAELAKETDADMKKSLSVSCSILSIGWPVCRTRISLSVFRVRSISSACILMSTACPLAPP